MNKKLEICKVIYRMMKNSSDLLIFMWIGLQEVKKLSLYVFFDFTCSLNLIDTILILAKKLIHLKFWVFSRTVNF